MRHRHVKDWLIEKRVQIALSLRASIHTTNAIGPRNSSIK